MLAKASILFQNRINPSGMPTTRTMTQVKTANAAPYFKASRPVIQSVLPYSIAAGAQPDGVAGAIEVT